MVIGGNWCVAGESRHGIADGLTHLGLYIALCREGRDHGRLAMQSRRTLAAGQLLRIPLRLTGIDSNHQIAPGALYS
jgi:hypothetical protein